MIVIWLVLINYYLMVYVNNLPNNINDYNKKNEKKPQDLF